MSFVVSESERNAFINWSEDRKKLYDKIKRLEVELRKKDSVISKSKRNDIVFSEANIEKYIYHLHGMYLRRHFSDYVKRRYFYIFGWSIVIISIILFIALALNAEGFSLFFLIISMIIIYVLGWENGRRSEFINANIDRISNNRQFFDKSIDHVNKVIKKMNYTDEEYIESMQEYLKGEDFLLKLDFYEIREKVLAGSAEGRKIEKKKRESIDTYLKERG